MRPIKLIRSINPVCIVLALSLVFQVGCEDTIETVNIEKVYQKDNGRIIVTSGQEDTSRHFQKEKVFITKGCFKCDRVEFTVLTCNDSEDNWNETSKDCVTLIPHVQEEGEFYLVFMEGAFTGSQLTQALPIFKDLPKPGETTTEIEDRSGVSEGVLFIYEVDFNQ